VQPAERDAVESEAETHLHAPSSNKSRGMWWTRAALVRKIVVGQYSFSRKRSAARKMDGVGNLRVGRIAEAHSLLLV
jgi:hypothetical protein